MSLTPTQLLVPQPQHTQLSQGEEKYLIFSKITPSINTVDTVCNNIYVLKTTTFWYVQVQGILRTQQTQIHLPSTFSNRKGQWPNISEDRKSSTLCHSIKMCPAHTQVYVCNTKEDQKQY